MWPFGKKKEEKKTDESKHMVYYVPGLDECTQTGKMICMHYGKPVYLFAHHSSDVLVSTPYGDGYISAEDNEHIERYSAKNFGGGMPTGSYSPDWMSRYGIGDVSQKTPSWTWADLSQTRSSLYTVDEVLQNERRMWNNMGYDMVEKTWFECSYCHSRFDGKDVEGTYNCPKCGAPITHYVKGY